MDGAGVAWIVGGYVVGTFPSTWLISRIRRSPELEAAVRRDTGEADAHLMTTKHLGWGWSSLASAADVFKGLLWVLAARELGAQPNGVLAAAGIALVAGHSFPLFVRDYAGRGLATSAGVLLVLLPVQMVIAGALILLGIAVRTGGLWSTLGMASVAPAAAIQGQPAAFVWMGGAILALIIARRLQGVGDVIRGGLSPGKAVFYRCVFDSSGPRAR